VAAPGIRLTAGWVARAAGGTLVSGDPALEFDGVSIDSRTLTAGDLFVAIKGERFDGEAFAEAAVAAGARGLLVTTRRNGVRPPSTAVIEAPDTVAALQALAREVRRSSGARVVAITGSAGKTTTKEVTSEFLSVRYRVTKNRGNLNNHIGLPLSLLELRHRPDIAVVELGMNHAGEIRTLVSIAEPDVRVWTNVGEAHLAFFASQEAIADAKAEILERATAETVLVANADDPRVVARIPRFAGRVVTFGIDRDADVRAIRVADRGVAGTAARVETRSGAFELETALVGRGHLSNVLAATAVALEFGIPVDAIAECARTLRPASRRGEVLLLENGVVVIDDSYNANPTATIRALQVLSASAGARRLAVLGEMLELGEQAERLHADVGAEAARASVDVLIAVGGPPARAMAEAAAAAGLGRGRVLHFESSDEAAEAVSRMARRGDLILVKGSRGIRTDIVVDRLKAEAGSGH
jgi:UDP-N-acetylmuramoyl-tripeptide--D-alanyl-D-alanine ligase